MKSENRALRVASELNSPIRDAAEIAAPAKATT